MENCMVLPNSIRDNKDDTSLTETAIHNTEPIRGSIIALIIRIAIVLIGSDFFYTLMSFFFLKIYFLNFELPFDIHHHTILILSIAHIGKNIIQLCFITTIALRWASRMYFIAGKQLYERRGILSITEKVYDLHNIRSVSIHQSLSGKLFKFGDVSVETSASGGYMEKITLAEVANPENYESKLLHNF